MAALRRLLAASLLLAAVPFVPAAGADPVCLSYREPPADSDGCVFVNEDPGEGNCAEFCFYVYTQQPLDETYVCYRTTVHDPYRCTGDVTDVLT